MVSSLLNPDAKAKFDATTRADYERLRAEHAGRAREKKMLTLEQARANRLKIDWSTYEPPVPEFVSARALATALGSARAARGRCGAPPQSLALAGPNRHRTPILAPRSQTKFVLARRQNQHARRVRSPDLAATPPSFSTMT